MKELTLDLGCEVGEGEGAYVALVGCYTSQVMCPVPVRTLGRECSSRVHTSKVVVGSAWSVGVSPRRNVVDITVDLIWGHRG